MKISGIYKITNLLSNKIYIGKSSNIYQRWTQHKSIASSHNNGGHIHNAIRKYGLENFSFEILLETTDLDKYERYFIEKFDSFNSGYNLTKGGDGGWSEINSLGIRGKGMLGHHHSEESKKKISLATKGRKKPEGRYKNTAKLRKERYGIELFIQAGHKAAETRKKNGYRHSNEIKNHLKKVCIERKINCKKVECSAGQIFNSINEASKFFNIDRRFIRKSMNSKSLTKTDIKHLKDLRFTKPFFKTETKN